MKITKDKLVQLIKEQNNTSKADVIASIDRKREHYLDEMRTTPIYPQNYYQIVLLFLDVFYEKVKGSILFDVLPDRWIYELRYEYDEFSLNIVHIKEYKLDDNLRFKSMRIDETYKLISVNPKGLSVANYAEIYGVGEGTVRQWIRRGKIRTAYKKGKEWVIPALSLPPSRGYESAQYKWSADIEDLTEEYAFLADYVLATFYRDPMDKGKYRVLLVSKETITSDEPGKAAAEKNTELLLDAKSREKLELFLISHPYVRYCGVRI